MRKLIIPFGIAGLAMALLAFSIGPSYVSDDEVAGPPRSLPEAYGIATQLLGALTNDYSCIRAERGFFLGLDERWRFVFRGTNLTYKTVTVPVQPIMEAIGSPPERPYRWREPTTMSDGAAP